MPESEQRFLERLRETVVSLPFDLKVFFELIDDEDLPDEARHQAAGVVVYVLGEADLIPDHMMPVGFVDDALILWLALDDLVKRFPTIDAGYRERFPDQFAALPNTIVLFADYLGDLHGWLRGKLSTLTKMVYKGKQAREYVEDSDAGEFLYTEALAFSTDFDVEQEYLERRLVRGAQVLDVLNRRRKQDELREK